MRIFVDRFESFSWSKHLSDLKEDYLSKHLTDFKDEYRSNLDVFSPCYEDEGEPEGDDNFCWQVWKIFLGQNIFKKTICQKIWKNLKDESWSNLDVFPPCYEDQGEAEGDDNFCWEVWKIFLGQNTF